MEPRRTADPRSPPGDSARTLGLFTPNPKVGRSGLLAAFAMWEPRFDSFARRFTGMPFLRPSNPALVLACRKAPDRHRTEHRKGLRSGCARRRIRVKGPTGWHRERACEAEA